VNVLLRVNTRSRATHQHLCEQLAAIGEREVGEHAAGISVRTAQPQTVADLLLALPEVYGVYHGATPLRATGKQVAA
jgi:hypothetical protein